MELTGEFTLIWSKFLEKYIAALYDMKEINVVLNFLVLLTRTLWEIYCSISRALLVNLRKIFMGGLSWSSRTLIQFLNNFKNRMEINNLKTIALFVKQ